MFSEKQEKEVKKEQRTEVQHNQAQTSHSRPIPFSQSGAEGILTRRKQAYFMGGPACPSPELTKCTSPGFRCKFFPACNIEEKLKESYVE